MPKMKTHSGAKKRFVAMSSGKIKRKQSGKRHLLRKRSTKAKRALTHTAFVAHGDVPRVKKLLSI